MSRRRNTSVTSFDGHTTTIEAGGLAASILVYNNTSLHLLRSLKVRPVPGFEKKLQWRNG